MHVQISLSATITVNLCFLEVGSETLGLWEWKEEGKHKSGLLSTVTEIDSDKGVNFCLLVQRPSYLIRCCWGKLGPTGQ